MTDDFEGRIYTVGAERSAILQLQHDYDTLRPQQRAKIKKIAAECNEFGILSIRSRSSCPMSISKFDIDKFAASNSLIALAHSFSSSAFRSCNRTISRP